MIYVLYKYKKWRVKIYENICNYIYFIYLNTIAHSNTSGSTTFNIRIHNIIIISFVILVSKHTRGCIGLAMDTPVPLVCRFYYNAYNYTTLYEHMFIHSYPHYLSRPHATGEMHIQPRNRDFDYGNRPRQHAAHPGGWIRG